MLNLNRISKSPESGGNSRVTLLLIACVAVFGLLRLLAACNDFYIDEIWSFYFASRMKSPFDAFSIKHDNNHILNTVYLYLVGDGPGFISGRPEFIWHRLLSVVSGTVSLWLLGRMALQRSRLEAFTVVLLAGLSYPLIIYSSEARGYAPAILFALVSFMLMRAHMDRPRSYLLPLFWATVAAAFLFHSSFIYVYLALGAWSMAQEIRSKGPAGAVKGLAKLHAAPLAFVAALYLFFLKDMVIGGGRLGGLWEEILVTAGMVTGLPVEGIYGLLAIFAVLLLSCIGLIGLAGYGSGEWVFYLFAVFIAPALTIAVMKPELIYFRYFLVSFPFLYLIIAHAMTRVYRRPVWGRPVYIVLLLVFIALNINSLWKFHSDGRGQYYDAVEYMTGSSQGDEILVGSDHDFRNKIVLGFYSTFFRGKRISYIDREQRAAAAPEWMLLHSLDVDYRPQRYIFDSGYRYSLEKSYPYAGVSGWSWFVYRRDDGG